MADDKSVLFHELKIHSWTLRGLRSLQFAIWCALGAQLAMIILIPMRQVLDIHDQTYVYYVSASIAALVAGGALGFLLPLSHHRVAAAVDSRSQLQERAQSAVEFLDRDDLPLAKLLTQDAIQSLEGSRSRRKTTGWGAPSDWRSLLAATLAAAFLLAIPPVPAGLLKGSTIEIAKPETGSAPGSETAAARTPQEGEKRGSSRASGPTVTTKATFKDTALASEPPDFVSFVRSGDKRLGLLEPERNASATEARPEPIRMAPQEHGEGGEAGFEAGSLSAEEATERMTEFEKVMKRSSAAAQKRGADQAKDENIPAGDSADTKTTLPAPDASAQARAGKSSPHDEAERGEKGPEKKPATPEGDSPGTPSSDQVEAPEPSAAKQGDDQDMQTARFGGGQYPHNAPGAGFPDWMRGNQDPHFMDAGQGQGPSTGKTSGQAGVGHALLNKGVESPTLELPSIKNLFLPGQIQDGEQTSYETEMLSPGTGSSPSVPYTNVLAQYESKAEEQMSRNHVPFAFRNQVKAYFSRIR